LNRRANGDPYPLSIFFMFVVVYMALPFYSAYIGVYQSHAGMSKTMIGLVGSGASAAMLFVMPAVGALTDRARDKNRVVFYLLMISSVTTLFFYFGYLLPENSARLFALIAVCVLFYQAFFMTALTLLEANGVEMLNDRKGRWDSGHIRLGGTVGFMVSALIGSRIITGGRYGRMFVIMSFLCVVCALMIRRLPAVPGKARKKERVPYSEIIRNRPFLVILLLQFTNSVGMVFSRYYNIYLTDAPPNGLGFDSGFVGLLAFFTAALEIPVFWHAGRIRNKIGMRWFMFIAVTLTSVKYILFSLVAARVPILIVAAFTGFSFVGTHFCTINFLNDHMPPKMRSAAQAVNGLVSQIFGTIAAGAFGGWFADRYTVPVMLRTGALITFAGGVLFFILFGYAMSWHDRRYGPNMTPLGPGADIPGKPDSAHDAP